MPEESDILSQTKPARGSPWRSSLELQQKGGVRGTETPPQDFEEKVDTVELLSQQLETQKCHCAELTPTCRGIHTKRQQIPPSLLHVAEETWNYYLGKQLKKSKSSFERMCATPVTDTI